MSGIYGYYLNNKQNIDQYKRALSYWNSTYGTDNIYTEINENQFFGVRLEHLSEKTPEQPSMLDSLSHTAVIDAIIYNRAELSELYTIDISELSDEQLIFSIITRHGLDALANINGDFAGVIFDKTSHTYTLFRDHMGIRPLFYYIGTERFVFSTDMRALLAIPDLTFSINEDSLYHKLTDKLVTDYYELDFNEIKVVRNASYHTLTLDRNGFNISKPVKYWTIGKKNFRFSHEKDYQKELRRLIEEAVQSRMDVVDGLIGAELSGGLDSSVLSILIHRLGREGRYFSWSFPPEILPITRPDDERNIISAVCEQEGFSVKYNTRELDFSISHAFDNVFPPYANTSTISEASNWFHSQGVKAVFTGHGGDQGVSHRSRLYELYYHKEYMEYFKALYRMRKGRNLRLLRTIRAFIKDSISFHKAPTATVHSEEIVLSDFLNPEYAKRVSERTTELPFSFAYDIIPWLNLGFHTDRPLNTAFQAAQYGVRYLYPYLDYKVIDYAVSIPRYLYNNGVQNRRIYIEAFRDILPETLLKYFQKRTVSNMSSSESTKEDTQNRINSVNKTIHTLVSRLDPDLWAPYLNMEKLKAYELPDDATDDDIMIAMYRTEYIFYCANLQNTFQHAIDPVLAKDIPSEPSTEKGEHKNNV